MTIFTVTTASDVVSASDGRLSLREAVAQANATTTADTILFATGLETQTLTLTGGELVLRQDVRVDGDRDDDGVGVTLSGGGAQRILRTTGGGTEVRLEDLALTGGRVENGDGGAIHAGGATLRLSGCAVSGSEVAGEPTLTSGGGGIFVAGGTRLTLLETTVENCRTANYTFGGGVFAAAGSEVRLVGSVIAGNEVGKYAGGGGIWGEDDVVLTVRRSAFVGNYADLESYGHAIGISGASSALTMEDSIVEGHGQQGYGTGALYLQSPSSRIARSAIVDNDVGVIAFNGRVAVTESTIAGNFAGMRAESASVSISNSSITNNYGGVYSSRGLDSLDVSNSIVAGNASPQSDGSLRSYDVFGSAIVTRSNGHNIFGSDVPGAIIGDLQGIAPSLLFAAIDPATGGGLLNAAGVIPLRNSLANPALSGGDSLAALPTDQLGHARPQPAGSLPDIGAMERNQALSTKPTTGNDVLTGTDAGNTIAGKAGADLIQGLAGRDLLRGEGGSDLLDGGTGNDLLDGGDGIDLARFGGSTAVSIDLVAGTARRGSEVDTLSSIQGAIGSSAGDTFKGDNGPNWFQGGLGRDVATGGFGSDLFDFDQVADSPTGSTVRDVVTDFAPGSDRIDLTGIDADITVAGDQAFRWVGTTAFGTTPGVAGYYVSGGNTIIRASNDADSTAELEIQLTGTRTLTADDFYG